MGLGLGSSSSRPNLHSYYMLPCWLMLSTLCRKIRGCLFRDQGISRRFPTHKPHRTHRHSSSIRVLAQWPGRTLSLFHVSLLSVQCMYICNKWDKSMSRRKTENAKTPRPMDTGQDTTRTESHNCQPESCTAPIWRCYSYSSQTP